MSDKTKQGHPTQGTLDWLELIELNARLMGEDEDFLRATAQTSIIKSYQLGQERTEARRAADKTLTSATLRNPIIKRGAKCLF